MIFLYIILFVAAIFLLFYSGKWLVDGLIKVAKFLGWREFVVAFFIVAVAGSIPNFFVGLSSAFHNIPQLSFGEIVGGNLVDLTIIVALAALVGGGLPAKSRMVQNSALFTAGLAVLPVLLILDGILSRGDGIVLIFAFLVYVFWVFSKKERFTKVYDETTAQEKSFKSFAHNLGKVFLGIILLLLAAEGLVRSASFFAQSLHLSIALFGILIVGLVNCTPEAYFIILSAKKKRTWMILGDLMGVVIVASTLVLGLVALICPIAISAITPFAIARVFLIVAAIFFLCFVRTDKKIS